jgi:hypothetical protein
MIALFLTYCQQDLAISYQLSVISYQLSEESFLAEKLAPNP